MKSLSRPVWRLVQKVPRIDPETAQASIQSGARFIVSPALNAGILSDDCPLALAVRQTSISEDRSG